MNEKELNLEREHLKMVLEKLRSAKEVLNESLEALGKENLERLKELREDGSSSYGFTVSDFDILLDQLHQRNSAFNIKGKFQTLSELEFLLSEPYFSRIDLFNPDNEKTEKYYIGKFSYTEDKPIITDWRSKVASVYYRYRYPQKNVTYDTPAGKEIRDLKLKRTFEIYDGTLLRYYNNDLQLDETTIISKKIQKRTGGVLEDIVQTIQKSQLDIIECDPRQVCIVQGCVGSGKSTVAIHKLAHIFFNYPKIIHSDRCLMVTKSQILCGYLSTLFPKLGIFDVVYKTERDVIYNFILREKLNLDFDLDREVDTGKYTLEKIKKLQRKMIETQKVFEKKILSIFGDPDLESYASFKYSYDETPYENVVELIQDLTEEILFQKKQLKINPDGVGSWLHKENIANLRKILKKANNIKNEILNVEIKKQAKEFNINISSKMSYSEVLVYMYIYSELIGVRNFKKFEYCIVDEAQDFSLLEYLFLDKVVLRGRFALFGDLNQSLEKDGIKKWEDIPKVIEDAKSAAKFKLVTNYRSTKQIIKFANEILKPFTRKYLPKSIDRVGEEPLVEIFHSSTEMTQKFIENFSKEVKKVEKSIGVIVFESPDFRFNDVKKEINEIEINGIKNNFIELNSKQKTTYIPNGVYFMKSDDCKGLEFSEVYILNLNLKKIRTFYKAKEAFVAVTRAMNELYIYGVK